MIKVICTLLLFLFSINLSQSQGRDNIWLLGYNSGWPKMYLDFSKGFPEVITHSRPLNFRVTNASICDTLGNLLFYANGISVQNKNHQTMLNGNGLNPGTWTSTFSNQGELIQICNEGERKLGQPRQKSEFVCSVLIA